MLNNNKWSEKKMQLGRVMALVMKHNVSRKNADLSKKLRFWVSNFVVSRKITIFAQILFISR